MRRSAEDHILHVGGCVGIYVGVRECRNVQMKRCKEIWMWGYKHVALWGCVGIRM